MGKRLTVLLIIGVLLSGCRALLGTETLYLYDLERQRTLVGSDAVERLREGRIVLVGEQHTNAWHHHVQLEVIRALHRSGARPAIGLEMFRHENQADLDDWVAGRIDEPSFQQRYVENWNYDWSFYRSIFLYAREHAIPMVGLNVPREISRQVARHGFESLTAAQRGLLDDVTCDVSPEYREFIRRAHEAHAHGRMDFDHFCQAQLLWDTAMAVHALRYLEQNEQRTLVLLAGSGHARKMGIPTQLRQRAPWPLVVVLPETPGVFEPGRLTADDADVLFLRNP